MNLTEPLQLTAATIGMVVSLILAFIPLMPGPLLLWGVGMIFGISEGFQRLTPAAGVVMTLLMVVSVTNDFWLPMFGVRTGGLTCLGAVGSFVGGIVGSFLIPIPILGTIIGAVAGAALLEVVRFREIGRGLQAGQSALKLVLLGYAVNIIMSIAIFVVYLVSIITTG